MKNVEIAVTDSVEWALAHSLIFKKSNASSLHCPFTLTPCNIDKDRFENLQLAAGLFGKLLHAISKNDAFIQQAIEPIADTDPLFSALLKLHNKLSQTQSRRATPLLIMRTDFMDDQQLGPKLIEFNGIAAGMGPFGQRASELHTYIAAQHANLFHSYIDSYDLQRQSDTPIQPEFINNEAIEQLADGIAKSAFMVKQKHKDAGKPTFVMVVQANEDNVYDQHLLEYALHAKGIRTLRKTFTELHSQLSTGDNHRLLLNGEAVDVVYLRAGYQQCDYYDKTIIEKYCCRTLMSVRLMLEQHDIAMNATIAQQLASSKRVQMLLSNLSAQALVQFGLTEQEALTIKPFFGEMLPLHADSIDHLMATGLDNWVLKNQGEGGGHCVFGEDIVTKLRTLDELEYESWSLMRKIVPLPRTNPSMIIRHGEASMIGDIISEIGIFTINIDDVAIDNSLSGYLVRSKPANVMEGGVHSGQGAVDSLIYR
ncbi:glutathione synthase [Moritella sp. 24]|uniref:glutathione synthase n=1 Tax=Moritella sp. 24 TaxID=2746230 RepID=UPI001BA7AAE0|nr:glutathione synthase [Moritella sp. 24]QUM75588.1 glutathione synthase [Moritella sp. 24]